MKWLAWVVLVSILVPAIAGCQHTTSAQAGGGSASGGNGRIQMGFPF
jgi:hypothetical protein